MIYRAVFKRQGQGENVADNAGLMLAYESYKRLLSANPLLSMQDPSDVGDLTNEQLYARFNGIPMN